jgi:hypothetical protein
MLKWNFNGRIHFPSAYVVLDVSLDVLLLLTCNKTDDCAQDPEFIVFKFN